jgi:sugar O-acyltransferase (sialic acid O-acetyltransferase NeuD family)
VRADGTLFVVGAGGAGREALDIAAACGREVTAFIDEFRAGEKVRGLEVLPPHEATPGAGYVLAIADAYVRARLAVVLDRTGLEPTELVHPRAVIGSATRPGPGFLAHANVFVSTEVSMGAHCQVHYNATIGHDCVLGDRVTVLPGANVAGGAALGTGVLVGSGAMVLQGRVVGEDAVVGAGAVVTRDVPPRTVVVGSPARQRSDWSGRSGAR